MNREPSRAWPQVPFFNRTFRWPSMGVCLRHLSSHTNPKQPRSVFWQRLGLVNLYLLQWRRKVLPNSLSRRQREPISRKKLKFCHHEPCFSGAVFVQFRCRKYFKFPSQYISFSSVTTVPSYLLELLKTAHFFFPNELSLVEFLLSSNGLKIHSLSILHY